MGHVLRAIIRKEIRQTLRDRRMVFLLVAAPFIQVIVFGFAVDFDVDRVPTVVADLDHSPQSRAHLRRLLADGTLARTGDAASGEAATDALVRGDATLGLVIAPGFGRDLVRGRPAAVQLLIDGSDPSRSAVAAGAAQHYFLTAAADRRTPRGPASVAVRSRVLYNPRLETAIFMVPGVAAMLLLIVTAVVGSMGLARERQTGTLEQILVTPVRPSLVLVGKIVPFLAIGLLDFALALAVGVALFDVPIRGSLGLLLGATLLYLASTLGAGLIVAATSRTQQQAFLGSFLVVLPAVLLAGILTPVRSMPAWLRYVTLGNPLRHYAEILRAVLLKGAGLAELWPQTIALTLLGAGLFVVAARRFQKSMA